MIDTHIHNLIEDLAYTVSCITGKQMKCIQGESEYIYILNRPGNSDIAIWPEHKEHTSLVCVNIYPGPNNKHDVYMEVCMDNWTRKHTKKLISHL